MIDEFMADNGLDDEFNDIDALDCLLEKHL
ncbi:hypothetical protein FHR87_000377 [Azomonas macrocytogenes]|uniref:Uncharacterized protein n=1 Tax=Azomonas macrocytogenes TaxID=69962 RepID=A0A839SXC9_AZOMA|nr:hypothetical protein [Azomonas macrocytogenes]